MWICGASSVRDRHRHSVSAFTPFLSPLSCSSLRMKWCPHLFLRAYNLFIARWWWRREALCRMRKALWTNTKTTSSSTERLTGISLSTYSWRFDFSFDIYSAQALKHGYVIDFSRDTRKPCATFEILILKYLYNFNGISRWSLGIILPSGITYSFCIVTQPL